MLHDTRHTASGAHAAIRSTTPGAHPKRDGFTAEQRFFLGFAQVWCENSSPESKRVLAQTDPHSPREFRIVGVIQNMPEFGKAFGCKAGQPMMPVNACRVW